MGKREPGIYDLVANDPEGRLVDRTGMSDSDLADIGALMAAMARLGEAERRLSEASQRYMKLNATDMKALHLLIVSRLAETEVTPRMIADHLGISSASTTKLLDRLAAAGHITRAPHPSDRRALVIAIDPDTARAATETIGRVHARRAEVAAGYSARDRRIVTRFLDDVADALEQPIPVHDEK